MTFLDEIRLDASSRTPLHAQLADQMRTAIRGGALAPGDPLPSEIELQRALDVSRSVVRQALSRLSAEGLLHRSRGRGTLVAPPRRLHRLAHRAEGLGRQVASAGHAVRTRVVALEADAPDDETTRAVGADAVRLERVRSVDGAPIAFIRTWIPAEIGASLSTEELTDASLHACIADRWGRHPSGGSRQVRAVPADAVAAGHLGVAVGAPLLLLSGTTTDQDGRVIEAFETWHRGDMVAFDIPVGGATAPVDEDDPAALARRLVELLER